MRRRGDVRLLLDSDLKDAEDQFAGRGDEDRFIRFLDDVEVDYERTDVLREFKLRRLRSRREEKLSALRLTMAQDPYGGPDPGSSSGQMAERPPPVSTPLDAFRWLCSATSREDVDDCRAELKRDARAMWNEDRSRGFIARVIWFRSLKCMLEITLDGCNGLMKRALPFLRSLGL